MYLAINACCAESQMHSRRRHLSQRREDTDSADPADDESVYQSSRSSVREAKGENTDSVSHHSPQAFANHRGLSRQDLREQPFPRCHQGTCQPNH